ncbi:hypothetical protein GGX14DRAFT_331394, partial [Mycena pura]
PSTMGSNYRYIHPEQKRLLPTIKRTVSNNHEIAAITGMNVRTVRRALKNQHEHGDVVPPKKGQVGSGWAADMSYTQIEYLEGLVERKPDSTLRELRQGLLEGMHVDVDESTVRLALHRRGFSFKNVRE